MWGGWFPNGLLINYIEKITKIFWSAAKPIPIPRAQTRIVGITGILRIHRYSFISLLIRSEICYWECSFYELNIMPWRGLEPPRSLARDFESRVSTISPSRHLSIKWIVFHEYDTYLMSYIPYMTKVECWSISIDRSYRPESDIKLLRFSLSRGYLIYKKVQSKLFLDSIEVQKSQYGAQIRIG